MSASRAGVQLRAPWQWRRNNSTRRLFWLTTAGVLALLGGPALAAQWWLPPRVAATVLILLASLLLMLVWGQQFAALLRLDHPHAARLVPGHAHALRVTALGLWAAMAALCGGIAALAAAAWGSSWSMVLVAPMAAGAALLYVAMALRWWWLWVLPWLIPLSGILPGFRAARQLLAAAAAQQWQAHPAVTTVLVLLTLGLLLTTLFGHADTAHARTHGRWGEWLGAPLQRLADAWLARVTTRASPRHGSVMARAEVVAHGQHHWVREFGLLVPWLLVLPVALGVGAQLAGSDLAAQALEHGHVGMSIGLVCMALSPLVSLPGALWATRREQALLMLLPGMPRAAALNRALAWRQTRPFLMLWVATLPALIALAWAAHAPHLLALAAVALPMPAWAWQDASRLRAPQASTFVWPYLVCVGLGLASMVLLREYPAAGLPWLVGWLLLSSGLVIVRWCRLAGLPQALPAGRLA